MTPESLTETEMDRQLRALDENLPPAEVPKESFERIWEGIVKNMEGKI